VAPSVQRRKVWLTPTTRVPCSSAAYIGEFKTWRTQSEFCTRQNSVTGQQPPKMYKKSTSPGDGQTSCNREKFGWLPVKQRRCSNEAKTRKPLKFAGVPQTRQSISTASGPKFTILWGHVGEILLLNSFFRLSIRALFAKIQPDEVVRWCPYGDFLRHFCVL